MNELQKLISAVGEFRTHNLWSIGCSVLLPSYRCSTKQSIPSRTVNWYRQFILGNNAKFSNAVMVVWWVAACSACNNVVALIINSIHQALFHQPSMWKRPWSVLYTACNKLYRYYYCTMDLENVNTSYMVQVMWSWYKSVLWWILTGYRI